MSRLDSFIRRISAQRDCLNKAAQWVADVPGVIVELGLGNGRTYHHLRELFPDREIFVFERQLAAHSECVPDDEHLVLGDIGETLAHAQARLSGRVALAHADLGSGDAMVDAALSVLIRALLTPLMCSRALVLSDQPLKPAGWQTLPLPEGVVSGRYQILRVP